MRVEAGRFARWRRAERNGEEGRAVGRGGSVEEDEDDEKDSGLVWVKGTVKVGYGRRVTARW